MKSSTLCKERVDGLVGRQFLSVSADVTSSVLSVTQTSLGIGKW